MSRSTLPWWLLVAALTAAVGTWWPAPPDRPEAVVLVGRVQELALLETAVVPLTTTVHGGRGEGWMRVAAGEDLLFQAVGEARAGMDLAELGPDDIWRDGNGVLWVRLPEARVLGVTLDEERSQVLVRQQGWFGRADRDLESQARRAALRQLEAQAEVLGLESVAQGQAERVVRDLLASAGETDVRFVVEEPEPRLW